MTQSNLAINLDRLMNRLHTLAEIGALEGGGCCRLALSDEDRQGRDLVTGWMRELGLSVTIDGIGNAVAIREGRKPGPPVMIGSHIDTVRTGGIFDGCLGVLARIEVIETLNDARIETAHPIAVAFFTNEEGARFAPDMMGSAVHQGFLGLDEALGVHGIDGAIVGEELHRIGYGGTAPTGSFRARCFFEIHVEQGPILDAKDITIGAVEGVQGISWTEFSITGKSNHAGTTPMNMRCDAGLVAARIATEARNIAIDMGGNQVATVGLCEFQPNLVNVIPSQALVTVDLRNTDEALLQKAETRLFEFSQAAAKLEGADITLRTLARFEPVVFDPEMVDLIARTAASQELSVRKMPSGAGHDAQMFAPNCPTAMIFVPSKDGISHNIEEYTRPEDIRSGVNVLLQAVLSKAEA